MDKALLQAIQSELNIKPYETESEIQHAVRLIYSACASWMRYFVLDEDEYGNAYPKTKKYLLNRAKETMPKLMDAFPECLDWFVSDKDASPYLEFIQALRERMLLSGELLSNGEDKVLLPKEGIIDIRGEDGWIRVLGFDSQHKKRKDIFTGVSRISFGNRKAKIELESPLDSEMFVDRILGARSWSLCKNTDRFEFFDPASKRPLYQSWIQPDKAKEKVNLGRIQIINGKYEYYMLKKVGQTWFNIQLPAFFQDRREHQRIMLGLRSRASNPMVAEFRVAGECILLQLYCRLPIIEETLLKTYCWPLNSFNDELHYVVPWQVWPKIRRICACLCIRLEEKML